MKKILVLGAGKSASTLIRYLLQHGQTEDWEVTVADMSEEMARRKTGNHPRSKAIGLDVTKEDERLREIASCDLAISLLPPHLHEMAAHTCLEAGRNLVTASYTSAAMQKLDDSVKARGLVFLNECGLDPGIDHMSAMQIIDRIRDAGGQIAAFRSYTGGLIAPESVDNPWGYKFTWNPRNVVMAGQGTAKYILNGRYRYIPYNRLFTETIIMDIPGHGTYEGYANRDSLSYRSVYGLDNIPTLIRGTLRAPGFCKAWNALVLLGWTDDSCLIDDEEKLTYSDLLEAYLPAGTGSLQERTEAFLNPGRDAEITEKLAWLGIYDPIPLKKGKRTAAGHLQALLEDKWAMREGDIDMIVMQHEFTYHLSGREKNLHASLVVKGEDTTHTAMSKTVGLPLGIAAKLILQGKITARGVHIPVRREIYEPVLEELTEHGIRFTERDC